MMEKRNCARLHYIDHEKTIKRIVSIILLPNVYESTKCDNNVRVTDFIANDLTFKTFLSDVFATSRVYFITREP